ncbi:class I SAM-dependent methyltransferase [Cohnella suwonensis]|uniref:Class I SAM-dependent methyltransferase n=1 Tax=Cohnella suwonensis TaxID=696072 RepID=A0ABW0LSJ5_9BACL
MIVTTTDKPTEATSRKAIELAAELEGRYVVRSGRTINAIVAKERDDEILIVGPRDIRLLQEGIPPFFYHPSMALVRLKRLLTGGNDTLLDVSGVSEGDEVVDCTAGLCADALVFSYAAGPAGRVVALEASPVVHALVREGLRAYESGIAQVDAAMRTIDTRRGPYQELLPAMPDKSADVVYFDPMFERAVRSSSGLEPLRARARHDALDPETVRHATRIARKKVVLKDHRASGQFERLGFRPARLSASSVAYGVIDVD